MLPTLRVLKAGRVGYKEGLKLQKELRKRLIEGTDQGGTLVLLQHDPVYTLGLREKEDESILSTLRSTGAEVIHSDRGGLTTFHGPGQLVGYPILNLQNFHKMQLRSFVGKLELVGVHACRLAGVPAVLSQESVAHTGAWVKGNKICAIGVHCKRYVTTHGLALNCDVDLDWFQHIVPCGIKDKGVTSLSQELGRIVTPEDMELPLIDCIQSIFKCRIKQMKEDEGKELLNQLIKGEE